MPPLTSLTPLTIVGGYLGAGKTTFINRLLSGDHGLRLAVLVNDFGDVNIDAGLIETQEGDTYTLTNGCICCSFGDDLSETLIEIARSENPPDEVVIEASGVADARRFATYSGEWIGFSLRGVVVLADIETLRKKATDKYVGDLVVQQLQGADLLVLNKVDLVSDEKRADVESWLQSIDVAAPTITTTNGNVPLEVLFDIAPTGESEPAGNGGHTGLTNHEAMFASTMIRDDHPWSRERLEQALAELPTFVVRAKGTVVLSGDDADHDAGPDVLAGRDVAVVVQSVGRRWSVVDGSEDGPATTEVVLIGTGTQSEVDSAGNTFAATCSGASANQPQETSPKETP